MHADLCTHTHTCTHPGAAPLLTLAPASPACPCRSGQPLHVCCLSAPSGLQAMQRHPMKAPSATPMPVMLCTCLKVRARPRAAPVGLCHGSPCLGPCMGRAAPRASENNWMSLGSQMDWQQGWRAHLAHPWGHTRLYMHMTCSQLPSGKQQTQHRNTVGPNQCPWPRHNHGRPLCSHVHRANQLPVPRH